MTNPANIPGTFSWVIAEAHAGKLSFLDFTSWWTGASFSEPQAQIKDRVSQVLAIVKTTEPNTDWVKGNWVQVTPGGVSVKAKVVESFPGQGVLEGAGNAASNATQGISSVLDFLNHLWGALTSASFWLRAVEIILGGGLILAGLAKLSSRADVVIRGIPAVGKAVT